MILLLCLRRYMSRLLASQITSEHLEMLFRLGDDFTNLIVTTGPLLPTSLVTIPDENLWFRHLEQKMHYRSRYLRGCKRSTSIRNRKYGDKMHWEASKWSIQHPQHPVCTYSKWLQENHEFSTSGSATSRMLQIKTLKKNLGGKFQFSSTPGFQEFRIGWRSLENGSPRNACSQGGPEIWKCSPYVFDYMRIVWHLMYR